MKRFVLFAGIVAAVCLLSSDDHAAGPAATSADQQLLNTALRNNKSITDILNTKADKKDVPKACVDIFDGAPGADGAPGPANTLAIGSVTTIDYGGASAATITGAAPNQTLNLTLVRGPQGDSASVTQAAVLGALDDPGGDPLWRQPLAPQTDATAMMGTKDVAAGNVRWYVTGNGTMVKQDANGKKRLELASDYSLKVYRGDGTTVAQQIYSSGRAVFSGPVTIQ